VHFVTQNPTLNVIIPHAGQAKGGSRRMTGFFDDSHRLFDTAVAPLEAIQYVLHQVGPERIIFGSDVSGTRMPVFNFPHVERATVRQLDFDEESLRLIFADNIERLVNAETW